jgi:hypothetical protein
MKYVMSWTDAPTFHHDLPFIPLHHTYDPSYPRHNLLPFTSLSLTSLHCSEEKKQEEQTELKETETEK